MYLPHLQSENVIISPFHGYTLFHQKCAFFLLFQGGKLRIVCLQVKFWKQHLSQNKNLSEVFLARFPVKSLKDVFVLNLFLVK